METTEDPNRNGVSRRNLVTGLGAGSVIVMVGGLAAPISSASDEPESLVARHLSTAECRTLEALGDTLLPGAADAGMAGYVNQHLGRPVPLLFLKYMDYPGSLVEFYKTGLHALDEISETRYSRGFAELAAAQQFDLIRDLSEKTPAGWSGPPAPLFYFVTRNDAADVYYGTPQGFEKLGVPYMALKQPPANW
jgi:hypothetical protein